MGDVHDFQIRLMRSGWVDWLQVVQSSSNWVAQFGSSVANIEATARCNINIYFLLHLLIVSGALFP
jgi:hypothetical protein